MKLEDLEVVKTDYDDLRFGVVDIFVQKQSEKLFMLKKKLSQTPSEHDLNKMVAKERMKIQHPNIL